MVKPSWQHQLLSPSEPHHYQQIQYHPMAKTETKYRSSCSQISYISHVSSYIDFKENKQGRQLTGAVLTLVIVHAKTLHKVYSNIDFKIYALTARTAIFYCYFVFSPIRCGHHSRTLLATLDSRQMFASATAALRTPPCLFLYAGARTDYTVKYTAAVKQLPASFAQIHPSLSLFSNSSSRSKFGASLPTYLPLATSHVT